MNKFEFTGARLTNDPEVKYTPTQTAMCNLLLAIDTGYGEKKRTDFPRVTVFGKAAENIERFCAKGLRVNVFGHIETGSFKKGDSTIYTTNLICERIEFVDFKEKKEDIIVPEFKEIDGDIPF